MTSQRSQVPGSLPPPSLPPSLPSRLHQAHPPPPLTSMKVSMPTDATVCAVLGFISTAPSSRPQDCEGTGRGGGQGQPRHGLAAALSCVQDTGRGKGDKCKGGQGAAGKASKQGDQQT